MTNQDVEQPEDLNDKLRSMILGNIQGATTVESRKSPVTSNQQPRVNRRGQVSNRGQHVGNRGQHLHSQPTPVQISHAGANTQNQQTQQRQNVQPNARGQTRGGMRRARASNFAPITRPNESSFRESHIQAQYLDQIAARELPAMEMPADELAAKNVFRSHLAALCQESLLVHEPNDTPSINLLAFGSLSSGFGAPGSDMDLVLVSSQLTADMPRQLEQAILDEGHGARLLTRTRVPILKVCENPSPELYDALMKERHAWNSMTPEEREQYDHPPPEDKEANKIKKAEIDIEADQAIRNDADSNEEPHTIPTRHRRDNRQDEPAQIQNETTASTKQHSPQASQNVTSSGPIEVSGTLSVLPSKAKPRQQKPWFREKRLGPLDFPKQGVGIQCDINFSNPLGLHNTLLLRCYSHCDARVRPMVLFVKAWASRRKINSGYNGTLSSYGYVLMVLHYLINIVRPPVCPNLQLMHRSKFPLNTADSQHWCENYDVRFWRNEAEIRQLAVKGMLSHNREPLGALLRGFFQYYAHQGYYVPNGGFAWAMHSLSLRTPGGILPKEQKGWTGAKTTVQENKEVRHRYLFAIEDPFELDHNVARTVTHNGIVAIRDELRRAWRIIQAIGRNDTPEGELLVPVVSNQPPPDDKSVGDEDPETHEGKTALEAQTVSSSEKADLI